MEKWLIKSTNSDIYKYGKKTEDQIIFRIIGNRGINNKEELINYLNPSLETLNDPFLLFDMEKACNRLLSALENNEKILIVGDYDVDGIMSTCILYTFFKKESDKIYYKLPHRVQDGYGINPQMVEDAHKNGIDLIITCDNGITAFDAVDKARELGIDIIITDHHEPLLEDGKQLLPQAFAIIDPKNQKCLYPFKELCGASVAYKLIEAMASILSYEEGYIIREYLEFAAIATVCDVVSLVGENRSIVYNGLKFLNNTTNIGIKALMEVAGIEDKNIESYHLGFIIGPMLNASGRLDTANIALELLLEENPLKAKSKAEYLYKLNKDRQDLTDQGLELVYENINSQKLYEDDILVVYEPSIHESVAGIIAGRLKDKFYKPTIVLCKSTDLVKGSARSIDEYNIVENISRHSYLLESFGGHKLAAGISLKEDKVDSFRKEINEASELTEDDLRPKVYLDLGLPIDYVNEELINKLDKLSPFGVGNPRPKFGAKDIELYNIELIGKNKNVLRAIARQNNVSYQIIKFSGLEQVDQDLKDKGSSLDKLISKKALIKCDIVYSPKINEWQGKKNIQLNIESIRF